MGAMAAGSKEKAVQVDQFVCFKLANEEYALDINCVQEVIRIQEITALPQLPDFVLGVVNIRGSVVPVFDLRKKLKLAEKAIDDHSRVILTQVDGVLSSYLVDEVLDNIKLDGSKVDRSPDVRMSISRECVRGLGVVDGRMIVIIDHTAVNKAIGDEIISRLAAKRR